MFIIYKRFYFDSNDNKNEYRLISCLNKIKFILEFALKNAMLMLNSTKIMDKNALYLCFICRSQLFVQFEKYL